MCCRVCACSLAAPAPASNVCAQVHSFVVICILVGVSAFIKKIIEYRYEYYIFFFLSYFFSFFFRLNTRKKE